MTTNQQDTGIEQDLNRAIDELQTALQRAADAASGIRGMLPRVSAISGVFAQLEAVVQSGRQQFGGPTGAQPGSLSRPTLVGSGGGPQRDAFVTPAFESDPPIETVAAASPGADFACFRIEFESRPGPLDLRAVDEVVSEHPAVRDVALLDYDGRKATLKVWIERSADPDEVQSALIERADTLFGGENDVTITALEDAA